MSRLADVVEIAPRDVRAVDIEADAERVEPLGGYVVSAHVLDAIRQITIGWQDGPRTRAWSVTGPFGAGKSAFVHLLLALHADDASAVRTRAFGLLRGADAQLGSVLDGERARLSSARGFMLAPVRGQREPASDAILRALLAGAERYWRGRKAPRVLRELRDAAASSQTGEAVIGWVRELAKTAPVLLVVDELGKVLEHAHAHSEDADLFVLQQLAEWFSGQQICRGGLLTLQHLAYEDYLTGVSESRRREWRKVQGRFQDLPFIADAQHGHRLLAGALSLAAGVSAKDIKRITAASARAEAELEQVAPETVMPSAATSDAAATYPLHPSAATALPDLAARYGQHDRTLIAFLAGESPAALPALLTNLKLAGTDVPFVRLWHLYDAIVGDQQAAHAPGADGARLREIRARIEDEAGLDGLELQVAKTIAVLNLIAARRGLRADIAVVEAACIGPSATDAQLSDVRAALDGLLARGLMFWRTFASEYRIWQGSDVDLDAIIADERDRLSTSQGADAELALLASARPPRPQVARRHSLQHHLMRFFEARYVTEVADEVRCHIDGADGLILTVLGSGPAPSDAPTTTTDGRPLIIIYTPHGREPLDAVLDAAAAAHAIEHSEELAQDPVARREGRHRAAMARDAVTVRLDEALDPRREGVCWFVEGTVRPAGSAADLSRELSELCDRRYPDAPVLRTEMLNRRELSSQGAKARGELLRAMFESGGQQDLAMQGHGPEASMYHAVLAATGLHRERDGRLGFGEPNQESGLLPAWHAIGEFFDSAEDTAQPLSQLWTQLAGPPFGIKDGPVPVLLAAALLYREDDVFLYQDGTFVPTVGSADLERLLKAPERYSVKRASMLGLRAEVFRELRESLITPGSDAPTRNASTLAVVRPLLRYVQALPGYTKQAAGLDPRTAAVRDALLTATEPDTLLFHELPVACTGAPLAADAPADVSRARIFVAALRKALGELSAAYEQLIAQVQQLIRQALHVPRAQPSLRADLRARSAHLVEHVIDPRGRGFLATASHQDDDQSEQQWLEALVNHIAFKPMASWTDHDVTLFEAALAERAAWFARLEALHLGMRPHRAGTYTTQLVTFTTPDGQDSRQIVAADDKVRGAIGSKLDEFLQELRSIDDHPERLLLAVLGERQLQSERAAEPGAPTLRKIL